MAKIALDDLKDLFERKPELGALYKDKLMCIALCQGAALHYIDNKNGIKDFDVWSFFEQHKDRQFPYRRNVPYDFGDPKFGKSADRPNFIGRRVDCLGRSLEKAKNETAIATLQKYLIESKTRTAQELAKKAVVIIYPNELLGTVVWPVERTV